MDYEDISKLIYREKELYRFLLAESSKLLQDFDTLRAGDFDVTIGQRQQIIDELQNIDTNLSRYLGSKEERLGEALRPALDELSLLRETATKKILEQDAVVIALAKAKLDLLKGDLAALARGKTALSAYESNDRACRLQVNDTV